MNSASENGLSEYSSSLPADQLARACEAFGLDPEAPVEPAGGTASPKVILGEPPRRILLRRRRKEFCDPKVITFDHAVIQHLSETGFPVVTPNPTREGSAWVRIEDWVFEAYPFIEDLQTMDPSDLGQLAQAAELLGRMHATLAEFYPAGEKNWLRDIHMATNIITLEKELDAPRSATSEQRTLAERMLTESHRVAANLTDERFAQLPTTIVHGDYTWANVMVRDGVIAGLFDFDWTYRQAFLEDLSRALLFMAFPRENRPEADSIWSLIAPWRYDLPRARLFLDAYQGHHPLNELERALLSWYTRECWLSCRIRAMRKVPDERKLELLTFGMEPILDGWANFDELIK